MMCPGLGKKRTAEEVANFFEVAESTLLRYPERYGGVRISGRVLFFDNLIEETVRRAYAQQTGEERQEALGCASQPQGLQEREDMPGQGFGPGLGTGGQAAVEVGNPPRRHPKRVRRGDGTGSNSGMVGQGEDPYGLTA